MLSKRKSWGKVRSIMVCLLMLLSFVNFTHSTVHAAATDIYVSTAGSDTNDGSQAHPYRTIQKGVDNAGPGSTVHVANGTYNEQVNMTTSGTAASNITVQSDNKYGAEITDTGSTAIIFKVNANYVKVKDFNIQGNVLLGFYLEGSHITIEGNEIGGMAKSAAGDGIYVDNANYDNTDINVVRNVIYNVGVSGDTTSHGVYFASSNGGTIKNNIIYGISGLGISNWHASSNVVISNNTIFDCEDGGILVGNGDAPGGTSAHNFTVTNNIAVDNGEYGIWEFGATGTNNTYKNNLVYGNAAGGIHLLTGTESGTITTAPPSTVFVNYQLDGNGNYNLKAGSPAIDAGTSIGAPSNDYNNDPRPIGSGYDIGATEYQSAATETLTFWDRDNWDNSVPAGYWFKQVLIDGTVVWEQDLAAAGENANTWNQRSVNITSNLSGKTSFNLQFRLISKQGVSNYTASAYWDDVAINGITITNPGFETTNSGWTYAESNANFTGSYSTSVFHGGTKSYSLFYPASTLSGANDSSSISQTVTIPATTRTLTFWDRDNWDNSVPAGYWYKQALIDGTVVWEQDLAAAGESANTWIQRSVDVTSNLSGKSSFTLQFRLISKQGVSNYTASAYWDDAAINGLTIANPGFETTNSGWTYAESNANFTGSYSTSVFHGGTQSYSLFYPASTLSSANDSSSISQTVTIP